MLMIFALEILYNYLFLLLNFNKHRDCEIPGWRRSLCRLADHIRIGQHFAAVEVDCRHQSEFNHFTQIHPDIFFSRQLPGFLREIIPVQRLAAR